MKHFKNIFFSITLFCLFFAIPQNIFCQESQAVVFEFKYNKGDKYRVIATVDQDVYVNHEFLQQARVINRIAFHVNDVKQNGDAQLKGEFSTSYQYEGSKAYVSDKIYESEYWQSKSGIYQIEKKYYMPTVRHIPSFPENSIQIGSSWTAKAEEVYDFTEDLGIKDYYTVPLDVAYTYLSDGIVNERNVACISASYTINYKPELPTDKTIVFPTSISGYSNQYLYWDKERCSLLAYEEQFKIIFELSNGQQIEYCGIADAQVIEAEIMDKPSLEQEIKKAVSDLKDVTVESNDKGITISLENIQFMPDSSQLLPGELTKIETICSILNTVPERDILIAGHTALAGTKKARAILSKERAKTIAEILIQKNVRKSENITVIGYGAEKPIADNNTEKGKAKNRRVEITILEN